ncbi:hypothetical protein [Pseudomonas serbica]|uniref:hypothetical protein n=1 Tax=Pseudomonas serbica TaxID=2965074 RepID=UPI00237A1CE0|nr:hypothetical protein [Pseudomonas serbica]
MSFALLGFASLLVGAGMTLAFSDHAAAGSATGAFLGAGLFGIATAISLLKPTK